LSTWRLIEEVRVEMLNRRHDILLPIVAIRERTQAARLRGIVEAVPRRGRGMAGVMVFAVVAFAGLQVCMLGT